MVNNGTINAGTLKVVPDDAEDVDGDGSFYGGSMVRRESASQASQGSVHSQGTNGQHSRTATASEFDAGTLVVRQSKRKSTLDSVRIGALREEAEVEVESPIAEEEDVFDGGTMITVRVTSEADGDEDDDEFHDNAFSPRSTT